MSFAAIASKTTQLTSSTIIGSAVPRRVVIRAPGVRAGLEAARCKIHERASPYPQRRERQGHVHRVPGLDHLQTLLRRKPRLSLHKLDLKTATNSATAKNREPRSTLVTRSDLSPVLPAPTRILGAFTRRDSAALHRRSGIHSIRRLPVAYPPKGKGSAYFG
jgi:hypothetical protein